MNLENLGWSDRYAPAFAAVATSDDVAGRVLAQWRDRYQVATATGTVTATVAGKHQYQAQTTADWPVVGDWVVLRPQPEATATIQHVLPRQTQFARQAAGSQTTAQVLAANVDTVFLVSGLDQDFNPSRIERYLLLAWDSGAQPVVVLNKADLCETVAAAVQTVAAIAPGVPVLPISVITGTGLEGIQPYLQPGQTVALLGSSGVGKSTLTNHLLGQTVQMTQTVRLDDSHGRHTTTHRQLFQLPNGAWLMDTPGLRELQVWGDATHLSDTFADIADLAIACRFRDCTHQHEPGCAVQAAVAEGSLAPRRLANYQKLQKELDYLAGRQDQQVRPNSKRRWKQIHKAMRHHPKR